MDLVKLFTYLNYLIAVGMICLGIWLFIKFRKGTILERLIITLLPLSLLVVLQTFLNRIFVIAIHYEWNYARLATTFAIKYGYPLYYLPGQGPIFSNQKGPFGYLVYLPATISNSPVLSLVISLIISILFFSLPIGWLFSKNGSNNLTINLLSFAGFIWFCLLAAASPVLKESAFITHVDAPALGLGALACGVLYQRKTKSHTLVFVSSAVLAILSVWTKQIMFPILLALPIYVWLAKGRRAFIRYFLCLTIVGLTISMILLILFNPKALFFQMFTHLSQVPWEGMSQGLFSTSLKVLYELFKNSLIAIIILGFYLIFQLLDWRNQIRFRGLISCRSMQEFCQNNPWILPILVAIFMTPSSIIARIKYGGDINSFSFTIYFLLAAALLALVQSNLVLKYLSQERVIAYFSQGATIFLLLYFIYTSEPFNIKSSLKNINTIMQQNLPVQIAYDYAKKHPNTVYFPRLPIVTLMSEGKMYHFEYTVYERKLSGFPVSEQHFQAYIPDNLQQVIYCPSQGENTYSETKLMKEQYFNHFSKKIEIDKLMGCEVYASPTQ